MSEIRAAQIVLFYLFDVAETIDLQPIPGLIGGRTVAARLAPKQATPAYVQYDNPPVSFDGDAVGVGDVDGFRPRFRVYDYGIISVALTRPFSGAWSEARLAGPDADRELRLRAACRAAVPGHRGPAAAGARGLSRGVPQRRLSRVRGPRAGSPAIG